MGGETLLLRPEGQSWGNLTVKTNCTPRYRSVTHDWPAAVEGDLAWGPASFDSEADFTLSMTEGEVSEVRLALEHFNSTAHDV